jgi:hypothetical protein
MSERGVNVASWGTSGNETTMGRQCQLEEKHLVVDILAGKI